MRNFILAALLPLAACTASTPAFAQLRAEVTAGLDDRNDSDITYGVGVGIDAPIGSRFVVGVEANFDNVFERDDYAASIRAGVKVTPQALVYGKVGYTNFRDYEGIRYGGGLEYSITPHTYGKVEYRYSDLDNNAGRHAGLIGLGVRF